MEALEFMKQKNRMCDYYVDGCTRDGFCEICPAHDNDCSFTTDTPEQLVAIVEQWVEEHPEKPEQEQQKPERERQKPEQKRQNPEQDDIEGAIYREIISHKTRIENLEYDVSVIWHNDVYADIVDTICSRYRGNKEDRVTQWRRRHKRCQFCRHIEYLDNPCGISAYKCRAKEKLVHEWLPRPFC